MGLRYTLKSYATIVQVKLVCVSLETMEYIRCCGFDLCLNTLVLREEKVKSLLSEKYQIKYQSHQKTHHSFIYSTKLKSSTYYLQDATKHTGYIILNGLSDSLLFTEGEKNKYRN